MKKTAKMQAIIDRVEEVRNLNGRNKSQFSAAIGLKPQTYNNFIGAQGSKPNVELVVGVCEAFNVNPEWLLFGAGRKTRSIRMAPTKSPNPFRNTTPSS